MALRMLHSRGPVTVRRQLRRLRVRFWHAPAARLAELLRHAGAPPSALAEVKAVVDVCRIC
eukprot:11223409-Lingulodinium_polyedra.AAC.1